MADPITRLNYFDHQFLRMKDFIDEQKYHIEMRRRHNRLLHTFGIADGLEVLRPPQVEATRVTINAGTAYDELGQEIVLMEKRDLELRELPEGQDVFVTIAYRENVTHPTEETGIKGNTRVTEDPRIEHSLSFPENSGEKIVLARVSRTGATISNIDLSVRRATGVVIGDLVAPRLTLRNDVVVSANWPFLLGENRRVKVEGSLSVTENINFDGTLTGKLGPNLVGTAQLADNAVTDAKISDNTISFKKIIRRKTVKGDLRLGIGREIPIDVLEFPAGNPLILHIVAHAYTTTPGGRVSWRASSQTAAGSPNKVTQTVTFRNESNNLEIDIKYEIHAIDLI